MVKTSKNLWFVFIIMAVVAVGGFTLINSPSEATSPAVQEMPSETTQTTSETETDTTTAQNGEMDLKEILADRVLGDENAPVTVIEYASLTCGHCAHFHETSLPSVKKQLIETGKVRFILRDFPLDGMALKASMMARCAPADKYYDLMEVLFANQARWKSAPSPEAELEKLGKLSGMSSDTIEACMNNEELETALLRGMKSAQTFFDITSTPSFVFNNGADKLVGVHPVEAFAEKAKALTDATSSAE